MSEAITELLVAAGNGNDDAQGRLFQLLYDELHRCAHRQLRGAAVETLSTTALVNETYLKLVAGAKLDVGSRAHFMALAARAMRQVLIDRARRNAADKRGGDAIRVTLQTDSAGEAPDATADVLALDQALGRLEQVDERAARVVQLHFFAGLPFAEIAELEGLTVRTVLRDWQAARALLAAQLQQDAVDGPRA